jgi:hypothetical protein
MINEKFQKKIYKSTNPEQNIATVKSSYIEYLHQKV